MIGRLLYKIDRRYGVAYWTAMGWLRYGPISNCKNALYFMKLAWHFFCGRLLVVTTDNPTSNGGYRYYSIVISKRPVSSRHTYEDL